MIDIEFYGCRLWFFGSRFQTPKEKAVTNAWKSYNDHLNNRNPNDTDEVWIRIGDEKFTKLLYEMTIALGYDYDEVQLRRDSYRPIAHANIENTQLEVLSGLASVLKNERSLPMAVTYFPSMPTPTESAENKEAHGSADIKTSSATSDAPYKPEEQNNEVSSESGSS